MVAVISVKLPQPQFEGQTKGKLNSDIAGTVQALTVGTRKASLLTTGGLANPVVSTVELLGSVFLTVLAIALPLLAFAVIAWALFFGVRHLLRLIRGDARTAA